MEKVHVVTDSTADLPVNVAKEWGITVVPLNVHFGAETFKEGVELTSEAFFRKLAQSDVLPRTSQPAPGDFREVYEEVGKDGLPIISLHIGAKLSGTYQSALMAKEMLPGADITVVDTQAASAMLGMIVLEAARLTKAGKSKEEVLAGVAWAMQAVRFYLLVDTLEFLEKNGRIGRAASLLGSVLSLKPILTISEGLITPVEKTRGKAKALSRTIEMVKEAFGRQEVRLMVLDADAGEEGDKLASDLQEVLRTTEVIRGRVGAVVGSHVGPGALVVAVLPHR